MMPEEKNNKIQIGGADINSHIHGKTTYEEAITLAGHGRFHWWLIVSNAMALLVLSVECDLMPYVLPGIECDFRISSVEKGVHNSVVFIGMICGCHFWSFIADSSGRRRVMMTTLFLDFCITLASTFMPTFRTFIALRFFSGFCISGLSVSNAYLGEFHSEQNKTKALLWMCIALPIASAMMPGLAMLVIPQPWSIPLPWMNFTSWRLMTLICIIPPLITLALFWNLPESPKLLLSLDKYDEALDVLRYIFSVNTGKLPEEYPVKVVVLESMEVNGLDDVREKRKGHSTADVALNMLYSTKQMFVPPYLICTFLTCVIQFGVMFTYAGFYTWLPDLLNRMADFYAAFPNGTATFCGAITQLELLAATLATNDSATPFSLDETNTFQSNPVNLMNFSDTTNSSSILYSTFNVSDVMNGTLNDSSSLTYQDESFERLKALTEQCPGSFDEKAITDTLIIAVASAIAYIFVGYIVKYVRKKWILVFTLMLSAACGLAMYYITVPVLITILPGIIIVVSSVGYCVVNAVVVDYFPTHLRAMAVGMSLTAGRMGEVVCSVMLGYMIQQQCVLFIFLFVGICAVCGFTSLLLPRRQT